MNSPLGYFLGILALRWPMSLALGQELPPISGPVPEPVAPAAPIPPNAVNPFIPTGNGIVVASPANPVTKIVPGGCLDSCLPCSSGGWSVGGGYYIMQPFFSGNPAFFTQRTAGGAVVQHDLNSKLSVAPLAFLGYTWANGWGIRGRWFEFTGSGSASSTFGNSTTFFDASGKFQATPAAWDHGHGCRRQQHDPQRL